MPIPGRGPLFIGRDGSARSGGPHRLWCPLCALASVPVRTLTELDADGLRRLVRDGEFFWLDLVRPDQRQVHRLPELIGLDPGAAARALRFGEVPQLRRFATHVGLVFYGAQPTGGGPADLVETHVYVSGDWVVTVRLERSDALDELRRELDEQPAPAEESVVARILEALGGTFDDLLDPIDEAISRIETEAAAADETRRPTRELREQILRRRRRLWSARRLIRRQRDYIDRAVAELSDLPGLEPSQRHEFRDVSGQMIRASDWIDDALDRLGAALDLLNSALSNRLNAIMERLTVVATIFLPLTVVTGYFGQNFAWMTDRIDTFAAFLVLGVGVFVASGVGIAAWVRSRLERQPPD
jgi:magnesium transporter